MEKADNDPYLSRGVIAYIGNKRRLLGLIGDAVNMAAGTSSSENLVFADLFSGSGVVSRFARRRGMKVLANDWEPYAEVLSRAWLEPQPADIDAIFGDSDGLDRAVSRMNSLVEPRAADQYLSKYYAPASDDLDKANYRIERLFYTRPNALKLDAARSWLEKEFSGHSDAQKKLGKSILLASILYAAATHTNTSGVFKAYHKGFGGHGKDALSRITKPIEYIAPVVIGAPRGTVFAKDAAELAQGGNLDEADVAYLDPPYNQHQYGSNYHMLNTITRWDRLPQPLELRPDGTLARKAGIRTDWVDTRSAYCTRKGAEKAFSDLLDALKAPLMLLSYSTDGIIPFNRLQTLCESYGKVRLCANPYVTYRGGRQSAGRRDRNLEFVLVVERGGKTQATDRRKIDGVLLSRRLLLAENDLYRPDILQSRGTVQGNTWTPDISGPPLPITTKHLVRIKDIPTGEELGSKRSQELLRILDESRCRNRDEELDVILAVWASHPSECSDLLKDVPRILRKLAHKKYRTVYENKLETLRSLGRKHPEAFSKISNALDRIEAQAEMRFRS